MSCRSSTVLVTGGSGGIGRAVVRALAAAGSRVAVGHVRNRAAAEELCAEIADGGAEAMAVWGDVTDGQAVDAMFTAVEDRWEPVTVLVNAAAVTGDNLVPLMTEEQWDRVLRTDLTGTFLVTKRALRGMVRARWGRIVNVGSVVGATGNAGQANYAAAKAGLVGLTRSLAREYAGHNITTNLVLPGAIDTSMTAALPAHRRETLATLIPIGFLGAPDDVAAAVAFLCSEEARYVCGAVIAVDGGLGMGH